MRPARCLTLPRRALIRGPRFLMLLLLKVRWPQRIWLIRGTRCPHAWPTAAVPRVACAARTWVLRVQHTAVLWFAPQCHGVRRRGTRGCAMRRRAPPPPPPATQVTTRADKSRRYMAFTTSACASSAAHPTSGAALPHTKIRQLVPQHAARHAESLNAWLRGPCVEQFTPFEE